MIQALLFLIILIIRLPPINLISNVTTHIFIRVVASFLFLYILSKDYNYFLKMFRHSKLLQLILLFLLFITLSGLAANNQLAYLYQLEKYFSSIILGIIFFYFIDKNNDYIIALTFFFSTAINLFLELYIYFFPHAFKILSTFFSKIYVSVNTYQFNRGRFFGSSFNEIIIPIILTYLLKHRDRLISILLFLILLPSIFISIASSWRTKTLLMFMGLVYGIVLIYRAKILNKFSLMLFMFIIFTVFFFSNKITLQLNAANVFDRLIYVDYGINQGSTVLTRISYWREAIEMGLSSLAIGVGVGNYFNNLPVKMKEQLVSSVIDRQRAIILIDDPHNIFFLLFATTGIFGLTTFLMIVFYSLISDLKSFRTDMLLQGFITAFWLLFIWGLFNPTTSFDYLSFFAILRGYIEKRKLLSNNFKIAF